MAHKLLVITAGTVAAGVGFEFLKQIRTHPASELHAMVRYIDTAYLPTRYSDLRSGEWFQMTISPQFMDNVRRNPGNYPYLQPLLYPGLLPQIAGSGGGSIRYNAAGAILINMAKMKEWLTTSMTNLVNSGDRQVNLSIALVVSSVGATGSGSLERLIDIIVECAQSVSIPPPLHCDVFILQPGMQGVTDLGLSNTLALYAEMAATRLASQDFEQDISQKAYRGRTLLVGWGSQRYMASIDELKEAAATLVRLTHDPATAIAAEFQEREVDNHVLREQDWQTHLPSHLSTATTVTISLGDLEEKIIRRDAVRLIDTLVFGGKPTEAVSGEFVLGNIGKVDHQAGPLLSKLTGFLQGETPEDRYAHLVGRLTEDIATASLQMTAVKLKDLSVQEQAGRLRGYWQNDKEEISGRGRKSIEGQGASLAGNALKEIRDARTDAIATGLSLKDLRDEYQEMEDILKAVTRVSPDSIQGANDNEVQRKIGTLERAIFRKDAALQQALAAVQTNIQQTLSRESHTAALEVLQVLQRHCAESLRNLEIVLAKLLKQRKTNPKWAAGDQDFTIDMNHLLHMAALSTPDEITRYADLVSIFAAQEQRQREAIGTGTIAQLIAAGEEQRIDPLAAFRKWLQDQRKLDDLFAGEIDILLDLAQNYASQYVHEEVKQHSVIDVLLQAGEDILVQRLKEAASKTHSLVSYNPQFASELRESRFVSTYWRNEEQRGMLLKAINQAFGDGQCVLVSSKDPSEIAVFYYADGLPMSAVTDLTGRCLDAFLKRRQSWYRHNKANSNGSASSSYNQRVGVPVYSGRDAEQRVLDTGVIRDLYLVRGQNVATYKSTDIPELVDGKDPK